MEIKVLSYIRDHRIKACNICIELSLRDYISLAHGVIDENEFQRKKVIGSVIKKTLKADIQKKCSIPAIVLGIKEESLPNPFNFETFKDDKFVINRIESRNFQILDGLQRTYVMLELHSENPLGLSGSEDWWEQVIRCEIYMGMDKLGLLYRMLTLNTGQTTMSTRHLMEILYYDYNDRIFDDAKLISDKDDEQIKDPLHEFKFREIVDGYQSYIEGNEVPLQRADILKNIEILDMVSPDGDKKQDFKYFLQLFQQVLIKFDQLYRAFDYDSYSTVTEYKINGNPFGRDVVGIFGKSQSITGFGAALHVIQTKRKVPIEEVKASIDNLSTASIEDIAYFIKSFDSIKESKKVGHLQRFYFKIFYTELFYKNSETYLDIKKSLSEAYTRTIIKMEE